MTKVIDFYFKKKLYLFRLIINNIIYLAIIDPLFRINLNNNYEKTYIYYSTFNCFYIKSTE